MKLGGPAIGAGAAAAALLLASLMRGSSAQQSSSSSGSGSTVDDSQPPQSQQFDGYGPSDRGDGSDPHAAVTTQSLPGQRRATPMPNSNGYGTPLANGGDSSKSDAATMPIDNKSGGSLLDNLMIGIPAAASAARRPAQLNNTQQAVLDAAGRPAVSAVEHGYSPLDDPMNGSPMVRGPQGNVLVGSPAVDAVAPQAPMKALPAPKVEGPSRDEAVGPHVDEDLREGAHQTHREFNVGGRTYYADGEGNIFDSNMQGLGKAAEVFKGKQLLSLKNAGILARAVK